VSSFAVTAERLVILPHTNADALELAQVGGFRAVVGKGAYKTGDYAFYIPEAALLPEALAVELGLAGRLAGPAGNRVKAIRLRGELSQGIVCRPAALAGVDMAQAAACRTDFAPSLGVVKWVPEVPGSLAGLMAPAPDLVPWIDIENIKRFPDMFAPGEPVTASEKAHGSCAILVLAPDGQLLVSSKGFGGKRLSILPDDANLYWRAVRVHGLADKIAVLAARLGARHLGLFGEVYGAGVQDLHYGVGSRNEPGYACFDAYIADGAGRWVGQDELRAAAAAAGIAMMPELYRGPYNPAAIWAVASGPTVLGRGTNIREGVVVRPLVERADRASGGRVIAKFVSDAYLLRKDGTEFE
jgi:RNA ligase (TIGR02306 family)